MRFTCFDISHLHAKKRTLLRLTVLGRNPPDSAAAAFCVAILLCDGVKWSQDLRVRPPQEPYIYCRRSSSNPHTSSLSPKRLNMSTANYDLKQCLGFEYPPEDVNPLLSLPLMALRKFTTSMCSMYRSLGISGTLSSTRFLSALTRMTSNLYTVSKNATSWCFVLGVSLNGSVFIREEFSLLTYVDVLEP